MADSTPIEPRDLSAHGESDLGIVDGLAQLSFLVQGMLARRAASHDLSMPQTRLLGVLRDREPTMRELARLLELDKSSATGLVDRAERRGLVQRVRSLEDRRSIRVRLTSDGRQLVSDAIGAFEADIATTIECLSSADEQQLSALATSIITEHARRLV